MFVTVCTISKCQVVCRTYKLMRRFVNFCVFCIVKCTHTHTHTHTKPHTHNHAHTITHAQSHTHTHTNVCRHQRERTQLSMNFENAFLWTLAPRSFGTYFRKKCRQLRQALTEHTHTHSHLRQALTHTNKRISTANNTRNAATGKMTKNMHACTLTRTRMSKHPPTHIS